MVVRKSEDESGSEQEKERDRENSEKKYAMVQDGFKWAQMRIQLKRLQFG